MKCSKKNLSKNFYLAGVSGGPDSMCLLDNYKNKIAVVCHVNYQKRASALRDQKIVETYCQVNNIAFEVLVVEPKMFDQYKNFQDGARKIRYDFFVEIANKYQLNKIFLGHNFNDFLESAYMQKIKSDQLLFYGIKQKSNYHHLEIERPLLMLQRMWIENYCQTHKIEYGIDESNFDSIYERNKIRKIIASWSKDEVFNFKKSILKINRKNQKLLKKINQKYEKFSSLNYDLLFFAKQEQIEKYHLMYFFLSKNNFNASQSKINAMLDFISNKSHKAYRLNQNTFLTIKENKLKIVKE